MRLSSLKVLEFHNDTKTKDWATSAWGGGPRGDEVSQTCNDAEMKSLLFLSVVALIVAGATAQSTRDARQPDGQAQDRLVGAWKLVSLEEPGADGRVHKADCAGQFVFTRNGKASVQVMYRGAQNGSSYAQGGYEASYGGYRIDDSSTFTFHIEGAIVRTLIGKDLKRAYQISGNRLTVTSTDSREHWRVVWERY